jgi:hypothetical protein
MGLQSAIKGWIPTVGLHSRFVAFADLVGGG